MFFRAIALLIKYRAALGLLRGALMFLPKRSYPVIALVGLYYALTGLRRAR
jgi:hypothetical protein